jgi:hypothetical protein
MSEPSARARGRPARVPYTTIRPYNSISLRSKCVITCPFGDAKCVGRSGERAKRATDLGSEDIIMSIPPTDGPPTSLLNLDPRHPSPATIVSVSRCLPSPQASVFYHYSLYGAMLVSRFLRVHKRPKRIYAKITGQFFFVARFEAPLALGCHRGFSYARARARGAMAAPSVCGL